MPLTGHMFVCCMVVAAGLLGGCGGTALQGRQTLRRLKLPSTCFMGPSLYRPSLCKALTALHMEQPAHAGMLHIYTPRQQPARRTAPHRHARRHPRSVAAQHVRPGLLHAMGRRYALLHRAHAQARRGARVWGQAAAGGAQHCTRTAPCTLAAAAGGREAHLLRPAAAHLLSPAAPLFSSPAPPPPLQTDPAQRAQRMACRAAAGGEGEGGGRQAGMSALLRLAAASQSARLPQATGGMPAMARGLSTSMHRCHPPAAGFPAALFTVLAAAAAAALFAAFAAAFAAAVLVALATLGVVLIMPG